MDANSNTRFDAALDLLERRLFREAVEAFSELVAFCPELPGAYGNRGLAFLNLGMVDEARKDFEFVMRLDPEDAMARSMLAELARHYGSPEETLSHVATALELDPNEPQALFVRGWLFAKAGQYDEAAEDLSRHLELAGDNESIGNLLDACQMLAAEASAAGGAANRAGDEAENYLGQIGWAFTIGENPEYQEQGLPCPYAHCIRNSPPLSPENPNGCPMFGQECPGGPEQVVWCDQHRSNFD